MARIARRRRRCVIARAGHGIAGFVAFFAPWRLFVGHARVAGFFDAAPHCIKAGALVQVVEVGCLFRPVLAEVGYCQQCAGGQRSIGGFADSGVARRQMVVIGAHDQPQVGMFLAQRLRHRRQVARVEGHRHRVARGFVDAGAGGEAFGHAQHAVRLADIEVTPRLAAAGQVALFAVRPDELKRMNRAVSIAQRQRQAVALQPGTVGLNALAHGVRVRFTKCRVLKHRQRPLARRGLALGFLMLALAP